MDIGVLQLCSALDQRVNLGHLEEMLDRVSPNIPDLIVAPEAFMTTFGDKGEPLVASLESLDGDFVQKLSNLAANYNTTIVAGMFESNPGGLPFNTTVAVTREGVIGRYRKIHLYDALGFHESSSIAPGEPADLESSVFEVQGVRIGLMTCFDLRFPEVARRLAVAGAHVLVLGAAWVAGANKVDQWLTLLAARAIENGCFVVGAAQPGPRYCGNSAAVDPQGQYMARASELDEEFLTAKVDLSMMQSTRNAMPLLDLKRFLS